MCLCARTSTLAGLMKDASPLSADLASPDFIVSCNNMIRMEDGK